MSIQVSACLNPFSQKRKDFFFEQGITVQEIINKIDALHAVNTGWRVMIDDEIITDFERIPEEGQRVYIKLVPEGDNKSAGVGMKIAGTGLAIIGVIVAACTGWTGIGAGIGAALIGAGIGMFSGGVALYNMNIPNTDREKPEQDPSVRGSRNQLRPYGTVPVLFGKRRIYADLCANPYTWVDSNGVVWLYQLFCVGQKDIQIDNTTIKIGETKITDYSSTGSISRILSTANPDPLIQMQIADGENTPPLYDKCVHEIQLNTLLKHQTEDGQDGAVIRTTPDKTTQLNVDIFFYNGLGKYNNEGQVEDTSVTVKAEYKRADQADSAYALLGYFSSGSNEITGRELKTKRYAITKSNLTAASYTIRITRVSEDSTDTKVIDSVYVGSIRAAKSVQPVRTERCRQLTLVGLKIKSSEKLNGIVEQLNFLAQSKLPTYNSQNSTWSNALSCNPASAAMYAMQGEVAQQKLGNSEIDKASFERLYTWCASNSYECNAYICEDMSISSLLSAIGSTCRAEILKINSKLTVIQDIARDSYVQLFTPRNSHDFKETMALSDVPDEMKMGFVDKDSGYAENEASVYNTPTGNKQSGVEPATSQSVPLWGVTDKNQALKIGMYNYAVSNHRFAVVKFSCDFEYLMCRKGDWIKYAGDIALAGLKQGRIISVQDTYIELDEEVTMEAGKSYAIRIRHKDGSAEIRSVVTAAGTYLAVTVTGSSFENPSELEGCLFTFGEAGNDSRDLIVTDIQCGENLSADLICVDYAPEIFGVDEPGFILPDFVNNLSETDGAIDSGQITQAEWRTFFTYHDDINQPPLATGDGTNEGWHHTKTAQSVWVSSKTARNIFEGEWSAPAYTRGQDGLPGTPGGHQEFEFASGDYEMTTQQLESLTWTSAAPEIQEGKYLWIRTRFVEGE